MAHEIKPDPNHPGKWAVFLDGAIVEEDLESEGEAKQVADMLDSMAA